LRSKLCQIELLTPLADDGQAVELGRLETSFSQVDRIRQMLAVLLSCVGLFSLISWWRTPNPTPAPKESNEVVEFVVKGQLDTKRFAGKLDGELSDVRVHAVFPDLPYEVDGVLSEDGTSFELPVSLVGVERPKKVIIEVSVDGERWRVPLGVQVSANGNVDVGQVEAEPPVQPPPLVTKLDKAPPAAVAANSDDSRMTPAEWKAQKRKIINAKYRRRGKGLR
jgi:hypothetical protein